MPAARVAQSEARIIIPTVTGGIVHQYEAEGGDCAPGHGERRCTAAANDTSPATRKWDGVQVTHQPGGVAEG